MKKGYGLRLGVCLLALLSGCGSSPDPSPVPAESPAPVTTPISTPDPYVNDFAQVDPSRLGEGLVRVRYTGEGTMRLKVQIAKDVEYNYDLANDGTWESFTLTEGNGEYTLRVLENQAENRYKPVFDCPLPLALEDAAAPFRVSSQFVCFTDDSHSVELAGELCAGLEGNGEKIQAVFDYVVEALSYDTEKSATAEPGYIPDVDRILEEGTGICFDYAAVMAAMLRSQGVACKLAVGYVGKEYHAWVEALSDEGEWQLLDPTFVSANRDDEKILDFVSDPENYKVRYYY